MSSPVHMPHRTRTPFRTATTALVSFSVGACVIAGAFTLLPSRYLGGLLWRGLGLI